MKTPAKAKVKSLGKKYRQLCLDFGQRRLPPSCHICGMVYNRGQEEDDKEHGRFCSRVQKGVHIPPTKQEMLLYAHGKARIIRCVSQTKRERIKVVLDEALGYVDPCAFDKKHCYVYLQKDYMVGCMLIESIEQATNQSKVVPAMLGVSHIWIHGDYRRQGIATQLLDTIRETFVYGMQVPKAQIAFTQPTQQGQAFMRHYLAELPLLLYQC